MRRRRLALIFAFAMLSAVPASAGAPIAGSYALPQGAPKVSAVLTATPEAGLRRTLAIAMTPIGGTAPIRRYDVELSKQLHVVAVSADLRDFLHEHAEAPDRDGHFRVSMRFPQAGLWHVYADGVPHGLGQQVMRFDLALGPRPAAAARPSLAPTGWKGSDGAYVARFDPASLKAGEEATLSLHLLRDGRPATDITPFLGVAAHAVFIDAADLTYVHVHAATKTSPGMAGMDDMPGMAGMSGMAGMGAPLAPGSHVAPDLALHMTAPKAGTYVLWLQFNGGGKLRTIRFVVPVAPAG